MLPFARKAVKDTAKTAVCPRCLNHLERVVPCVRAALGRAAMNDDRPMPGRSNLHLLRESELLLLSRRVVIIIIQADLSHGNYVRVGGQLRQRAERRLGRELRLMGMYAGSRQNPGNTRPARISAAQIERLMHRVRAISDSDG